MKISFIIFGTVELLNGLIGYHLGTYSWMYTLFVTLFGVALILFGENMK